MEAVQGVGGEAAVEGGTAQKMDVALSLCSIIEGTWVYDPCSGWNPVAFAITATAASPAKRLAIASMIVLSS